MLNNEPIHHAGIETLSFRQIDQLNRMPKGTAFRLFKVLRQELVEGGDYYYLPALTHAELIHALKVTEQVYATTVNLVLFSRAGYGKLRQRSLKSDSGA